MFEPRHRELLPLRAFVKRMARHIGAAAVLVLATTFLGALAYRALEHLSWLDGLLNASLIITGNGPAFEPSTAAGKVFTVLFAQAGVLVFVAVTAVVIVPVIHRLLHAFHRSPPEIDATPKD